MEALQQRIRILLWIFIFGLVVSGATAIPLETEVNLLARLFGVTNSASLEQSGLLHWIAEVRNGITATNAKYPFIGYGTDWLAFAHFVIAVAFIGPLREPVKNVWVVEFGMIACALVVPFALVMGGVRGIPFGWRLIDCSFGIFGIIPLWFCRRLIKQLAQAKPAGHPAPTV